MRPNLRVCLWLVLAVSILGTSAARAQEPGATEQPGLVARAITWGSDTFAAPRGDGFYPELGHLLPGAGLFRGGPGYRRHLFDGSAVVDASAAVSSRRYSMARASIEWPAAFGGRATLGGVAQYQESAAVNFFGIGAGTSHEMQTDYRIHSLDLSGIGSIHVNRALTIDGGAGVLNGVTLGSGRSGVVPSIEQRFDAHTAPGLDATPRYLHADVSVEHDSRDLPAYPARGALYRLTATAFHDTTDSAQSFRRVDAETLHVVPILHDDAGLVIHGRLTMSGTSASNAVPFYMMPTLGGGETLRGYSDFRFRDRNAAVLNLEYRWRVFTLMDAAAFWDIGTVAPTAADLLRDRRASDYGFGVRLHSESRAIGRVDIARGSEGIRVAFSMTAPFGSNHRDVPAPYVP